MENLILLAHLVIALIIVGLILMQQGKGAEMGASFGSGGSQTLFGASGSGSFFARLTAIFAFAFFVTSFSLAIIAKKQSEVGDDIPLPELQELDIPVLDASAPVEDDVPVLVEEPVDEIIEAAPVIEESPSK